MTVLVAGATGATGRHLVRQLLDRGHRVKAVVRSPDRLPSDLRDREGLEVIVGTILDLPEAEQELVAGYFVEYGSMRWAIFMLAEYVAMISGSCVMVALFFGGWLPIPVIGPMIESLLPTGFVTYVMPAVWFLSKVAFFMFFFVWVRWTFPRLRYDQLMTLGWKVLLPLGLFNIFLTGIIRIAQIG